MGYISAAGMREVLGDGPEGLDIALRWHLQSNHYPPVPLKMLPVCKLAIEAAKDEDWQRMIELPQGVSWKGQTSAPASAIIEGHHLEAFL